MSPKLKKTLCVLGVFSLLFVVCQPVMAGTSTGMPWEDSMETIQNFFTGPFAKVAGVIAIVVLGVSFAMAEGSGGARRLIGVFFGLALAFSAVSWGLDFLGFKDSGLANEYQAPKTEMKVQADQKEQQDKQTKEQPKLQVDKQTPAYMDRVLHRSDSVKK